ncbi:MAG: methylenetetrahydrofolate reductase [Ignavibacteriales bacterium]
MADIIGKYFMELLTPKQDSPDIEKDLDKFQERYRLFLDNDYVICITDNPMGNLSYTAPEVIDGFELPVNPENLMIHLNTFHRKTEDRYEPGKELNEQDLDILLQHAVKMGAKYLLCVSGDGSERLPRLRPEDLGYDPSVVKTVTSVQLIEYIKKAYPGKFTMGVAFNHYEPFKDEMEKLERKLAAGACFIITQPVVMNEATDPRIGVANKNLREMLEFADSRGIQVVLEAWMSQKMANLLPECVGYDINFGEFEPYSNLKAMREAFPGRKFYFSMIFGPQSLQKAESLLK